MPQGSPSELPISLSDLTDRPALARDRSVVLAEIWRNHYAVFVRLLSARTGSVEDAKEIVQEAFAKMLARDCPGAVGLLVGYLWRVAANLANDRKRRQNLHESYTSTHAALSRADEQVHSAESTVEARERLAIVGQALWDMPARAFEAFVLHVLTDLTFGEVGREMAISERMAKKHVARALEYLQHRLDVAETPRGSPQLEPEPQCSNGGGPYES